MKEKRTERLVIMVTEKERELIEKRAKKQYQTVSNYGRIKLLEGGTTDE